MVQPARRLADRRRLNRPIEAVLLLCRGDQAPCLVVGGSPIAESRDIIAYLVDRVIGPLA